MQRPVPLFLWSSAPLAHEAFETSDEQTCPSSLARTDNGYRYQLNLALNPRNFRKSLLTVLYARPSPPLPCVFHLSSYGLAALPRGIGPPARGCGARLKGRSRDSCSIELLGQVMATLGPARCGVVVRLIMYVWMRALRQPRSPTS